MYLTHFGLRELPFTLTPDTTFFLSRAGYQDALNVMLVALRSGEGFVKVVGEVGTGKTLLCRKLINTLGDEVVTAYLHNPYLDPKGLMHAVADELGVPAGAVHGHQEVLKRLSNRLLALHQHAHGVILCLDEVQAMPVETLEALRLLTNLETEKRKLLQVVLFGQPELDRLLNRSSLRQLKQRITYSYRLMPMNRAGLDAYIAHRLAVAGYEGPPLFSRAALNGVHEASTGIPRLVNVICHKAMLVAYGKGAARVTHRFVRTAVGDTLSVQRPRWSEWLPARWGWLFGALMTTAVALIAGH